MKLTFKERELMKNVTLTVTIKRDWRVQFGLWLIKLGCRLAGIGYKQEGPSRPEVQA
jgi:hypothetical protein